MLPSLWLIALLLSLSNAFDLNLTSTDVSYRHRKSFSFVAGVAYSPISIGDDPNWNTRDYFADEAREFWFRDLGLIRRMGANVIRIYGWDNELDHTLFLDTVAAFDLKVIVTFCLSTVKQNPVDTIEQREQLKTAFVDQVLRYQHHPALFGWIFGNEVNALWNGFITSIADSFQCNWSTLKYPQGCYQSPKNSSMCDQSRHCAYSQLFRFINSVVTTAQTALGPNNLLFSSSFADVDNIVDRISEFDSQLTGLDAWSLQVYRGKSFGDLLSSFQTISSKWLLISEYGIDAWFDSCGTSPTELCFSSIDDPQGGYESPELQLEYDVALSKSLIESHQTTANQSGGAVLGGVLMSWIDERWKASSNVMGCDTPYPASSFDPSSCGFKAHTNCPTAQIDQPASSELCGYYLPSSPDQYCNEGYFGICRTSACELDDCIDIVTPRPVYYAMMRLWLPRNPISHSFPLLDSLIPFYAWIIYGVSGMLLAVVSIGIVMQSRCVRVESSKHFVLMYYSRSESDEFNV